VKGFVFYRTLGCKQNQFDTQSLIDHVLTDHFKVAADAEEADWFILNTCAVTERAMAKARGEINRVRHRNPGVKIIVLGCGAKCNPGNFTGADYINQFPPEFDSNWDDLVGSRSGIGSTLCPPHGYIPGGRSRAYLRIQNGCDQRCTFCIVPLLRGPSKSVPLIECIEALKELAGQGVKEIVLTGTNIALWGRDLPDSDGLQQLLAGLADNIEDARLRMSSLEPQLITPELISWCLNQPQICRHFHFAIQSGSSRVLKLMNRGEPSAELVDCLKQIKADTPDVSIGADVIAGFPGESDDDFNATVKLIESIPINYLHVFPYSERPGTAAVNQSASVPQKIRLERATELRMLDENIREDFTQRNSNKIHDIVALGDYSLGNQRGLTTNYLKVAFAPSFNPPGSRFRSRLIASGTSMILP